MTIMDLTTFTFRVVLLAATCGEVLTTDVISKVRTVNPTDADQLNPADRTINPSDGLVRLLKKRSVATCDPVYASTPHYLCDTDVGETVAVDDVTVLNYINQIRSDTYPPAANLMKLTWSDELAAIGAKWSARCNFHEFDSQMSLAHKTLPGVSLYDGIFAGFLNLSNALASLIGERKYATFANGSTDFSRVEALDSNTLLVSEYFNQVGCGQAFCADSSYQHFYMCTFAVGRYATPYGPTPYIPGDTCSPCQEGKCVNKLCDCGGKICLNYGKLNRSSCTCQCQGYYSGATCQDLTCPAVDSPYCSVNTVDKCASDEWTKLSCPVLCGLCPQTCPQRCENGADQDPLTCKCSCPQFDSKLKLSHFSGPTCGKLRCPECDPAMCVTETTDSCTTKWNLKFFCPHLCSMC